jgi:hypothetical protein
MGQSLRVTKRRRKKDLTIHKLMCNPTSAALAMRRMVFDIQKDVLQLPTANQRKAINGLTLHIFHYQTARRDIVSHNTPIVPEF